MGAGITAQEHAAGSALVFEVADVSALVRLDHGIDPARAPRVDREPDAAGLARQTLRQLLPAGAAVGGLEDAADGAARAERPGGAAPRVHRGVEHARVVR